MVGERDFVATIVVIMCIFLVIGRLFDTGSFPIVVDD